MDADGLQNSSPRADRKELAGDCELPESIPASVADQRYTILEKLGGGCFGQVYRGHDTETGEDVAVKFEDMFSGFLLREVDVLRRLSEQQSLQAFALLHHTGTSNGLSYMVMECLGATLLQHLLAGGGRLSAGCVRLVGEQVVSSLEWLHAVGIVHRDVKPENFLTGRGDKVARVYLTDFGLSAPYHGGRAHLAQEDAAGFYGSFRYAAVTAHQLRSQSRRDDLEAAGYMLVFLALGALPWAAIRGGDWVDRNARVLCLKQAWEPRQDASSEQLLPTALADYVLRVRALVYKERPDYDALRQILHDEEALPTMDWLSPTGGPATAMPSSPGGRTPLQPEDRALGRRLLRAATGAASSAWGGRHRNGSQSDLSNCSDSDLPEDQPANQVVGTGRRFMRQVTGAASALARPKCGAQSEAPELVDTPVSSGSGSPCDSSDSGSPAEGPSDSGMVARRLLHMVTGAAASMAKARSPSASVLSDASTGTLGGDTVSPTSTASPQMQQVRHAGSFGASPMRLVDDTSSFAGPTPASSGTAQHHVKANAHGRFAQHLCGGSLRRAMAPGLGGA